MSMPKFYLQFLQFLRTFSKPPLTIPKLLYQASISKPTFSILLGKNPVVRYSSLILTSSSPTKQNFLIINEYTLSNALKAASLESPNHGKQIQGAIIKFGFHQFTILMTALMNFSLKCGDLRDARDIFDEMSERDVVSWTSLIVGYSHNHKFTDSLNLFWMMIKFDVIPNGYSFSGALSACSGLQALEQACSHGGLIDRGWKYFRLMTEENLISAGPEHYSCMVDLLCRRGHLLEALQFIKEMPLKPSISVWATFLNLCRSYGDIELAQFAARKILELDPENSSNFVVLSNMYAAEFVWNETEKIRKRMKNTNVKKEPGCSWVELKNGVHVFLTADKSHPEMNEISSTLKGLMRKCWIDKEYYMEELSEDQERFGFR